MSTTFSLDAQNKFGKSILRSNIYSLKKRPNSFYEVGSNSSGIKGTPIAHQVPTHNQGVPSAAIQSVLSSDKDVSASPNGRGLRGKLNKVVLAYSGGLDTSVIVPWLRENYGCEVVCFTADVGQGDMELDGLMNKAIA
ncbi:argininosuccinate synthase domain-containing protein, partial [Mycobacterium tuberculosis]|uniref:argininosuccinate synthase domain-containing protein n=1 Tax=Mycobacterium tuberculosis TaxID=1773 RepID=UPI003C6E1090